MPAPRPAVGGGPGGTAVPILPGVEGRGGGASGFPVGALETPPKAKALFPRDPGRSMLRFSSFVVVEVFTELFVCVRVFFRVCVFFHGLRANWCFGTTLPAFV